MPVNCDKCGKPVLPGEARYSAMPEGKARHADCHDWRTGREKLEELLKDADAAKVKLSRAIRNLKR